MDIITKLDELAELRETRNWMVEDIDKQITELEAKRKAATRDVDCAIQAMESAIKEAVIVNGVSVKGTRLHAVWMNGRIKWDDKGLQGYAVVHPEVLVLRSQEKPTVVIREVKGA